MAEYWVTKDVQEFYLINATDQQHAENIASKHLHTLYKIVDSEVKDIRVEKKSTTVQVGFINRENREDMKEDILDMLGVNHFKWSSLECLYCKNTIDMEEYKNSDEGSWLSEYVGK